MKKWAIVSVDQGNGFEFFLPLTARVWKDRIGYGTLAILVGTKEQWLSNPRAKLALEEANNLGVAVHFTGETRGLSTPLISHMVRCHVGMLSLDPADYYLTSDGDMWPISRAWFNEPFQDPTKRVHIHYANAYDGEWFPMCYVGTTIATWREIMNLNEGPIMDAVGPAVSGFTPDDRGWAAWMWNEQYFAARLKKWPGFPLLCQLINRVGKNPPVDRIDRACWPNDVVDLSGKVDAHLLRPGYSDQYWPSLSKLFKALLPDAEAWANQYRDRYVRI